MASDENGRGHLPASNLSPPPRARRILARLLPGEARVDYLHTVDHLYRRRVQSKGRLLAFVWYWLQVVDFWVRIRFHDRPSRRLDPDGGPPHHPTPENGTIISFMATLKQDLNFSVRRLLSTPLVTTAALLSLSLAVGANGAIVGAVKGLLLTPLPFHEPGSLVNIWATYPDREGSQFSNSYPNYVDFREIPALEDLAAFQGTSHTLAAESEPFRVVGMTSTANLFRVLAVDAALGRTFLEGEDGVGGERVALLSHKLWQEQFNGNREILGRGFMLDGEPYAVVGVMPPGFFYPHEEVQLWTPLLRDESNWSRTNGGLQLVGRVSPGSSPDQVQAQTAAVASRLNGEYPGTWLEAMTTMVQTVPEALYGDGVKLRLYALWSAVGLLLLIACINVANLLLARSTARRREVAVRSALGAGQSRIMALFLTESLTLGLVSGLLGVGVAWAGVRLLRWAALADAARAGALTLDPGVMVFTVALGTLTGVFFGIYPAFRVSRAPVARVIQEGGRGRTESVSGRRLQRGFVVAQVSLTLMVLLGAGLMVRTMSTMLNINPGFQPRNVLTSTVSLTSEYDEPEKISAFQERVLTELETLPGVEAAGVVFTLPLAGMNNYWDFFVESDPEPGAIRRTAGGNMAGPGYFEAMEIPLLRGRLLEAGDRRGQVPVVVVSQAMADATWPGEDPLGKRLGLPGETRGGQPHWRTVVGVVGDVRHGSLTGEARGEIYKPFSQTPWLTRLMTFTIKTAGSPERLANAVRGAVLRTDPNQAVYDILTMEDRVSRGRDSTAGLTWLLGVFGVSALFLSSLGIFGVASYAVSQRRHEMGIRVALGAERGVLTGMMIRQGLLPVVLGTLLGGAVAAFLVRMLADLLYEVNPLDPATFASVPLLLILVGLLAVYLPAQRASRVEAVETLRSD